MKEKIIKMIDSPDMEVVELGILLALDQGKEWCLNNFSYESLGDKYSKFHQYITPIYLKGDIGIRIAIHHLICKERSDWNVSLSSQTIIDYDNK